MTATLASHILDAIRDGLEPRSEAGDWNLRSPVRGVTLALKEPGGVAGQRSNWGCRVASAFGLIHELVGYAVRENDDADPIILLGGETMLNIVHPGVYFVIGLIARCWAPSATTNSCRSRIW